MCFEWDKRYFRELEEKKAREKLDETLRKAEEAVARNIQDPSAPSPSPTQTVSENAAG
jgi:hypothetical protein